MKPVVTHVYTLKADPYGNTIGNNEVPPVSHYSSGQQAGRANGTTGKMERIIGKMVGSKSLQAKGAEKQQASQAQQSQRAHLAEAERLEHEAVARRERAVAHGQPATAIEFLAGSDFPLRT